jgi:hypothetical protein
MEMACLQQRAEKAGENDFSTSAESHHQASRRKPGRIRTLYQELPTTPRAAARRQKETGLVDRNDALGVANPLSRSLTPEVSRCDRLSLALTRYHGKQCGLFGF